MKQSIKVRAARSHEAEHLSDLALRSKAHWGYSQEFLRSCVKELTIQSYQIDEEQLDVFVAERNGEIAGFHGLEQWVNS